jgi:hypothetical protein
MRYKDHAYQQTGSFPSRSVMIKIRVIWIILAAIFGICVTILPVGKKRVPEQSTNRQRRHTPAGST